jgi:hypothetical protein
LEEHGASISGLKVQVEEKQVNNAGSYQILANQSCGKEWGKDPAGSI